ncbi:hypothetical protein JMJ78_0006203 [Colletotrichum scovillei]|nr:hypothetical protein JMJ78_0006203 [Colletotrichum scovillei]
MMHPAPRHIHPSITPQERLRLPTNTVHKKLFSAAMRWLEEEGTCRGAMLQKRLQAVENALGILGPR